MKIKRIIAVVAMLAVIAMLFSACSLKVFKVTGGAKIGRYTAVLEELVELWREDIGYRFTEIKSSNGSKVNLASQETNGNDITVCGSDFLVWSRNGFYGMGGTKAVTSRLLCGLYTDYLYIVVREDSPIQTVGDIKQALASYKDEETGKMVKPTYTVSMDGNDGSSFYCAKMALEGITGLRVNQTGATDMTMKRQPFYTGLEELQNGTVDMVIGVRPLNDETIENAVLDEENPLRLISLSESDYNTFKQNYIAFDSVQPLKDVEGKINMVGITSVLIVPETLSDKYVKGLLGSILDNMGNFDSELTANLTPERILHGCELADLHPAALELYIERGILQEGEVTLRYSAS